MNIRKKGFYSCCCIYIFFFQGHLPKAILKSTSFKFFPLSLLKVFCFLYKNKFDLFSWFFSFSNLIMFQFHHSLPALSKNQTFALFFQVTIQILIISSISYFQLLQNIAATKSHSHIIKCAIVVQVPLHLEMKRKKSWFVFKTNNKM